MGSFGRAEGEGEGGRGGERGERGMKEFVRGEWGRGGTQGRGVRTRIIHVMVLAFACLGPLSQLGPFVFSMAEDGFSGEIIIIMWTPQNFLNTPFLN